MLDFRKVITKNILLILQKNIMKKMIFSAVALVAFSFAGMANEVKQEVKTIEITKPKKIEVVKKKDCFLIVSALMDFIESQIGPMDQDTAISVNDNLMATCEGNN